MAPKTASAKLNEAKGPARRKSKRSENKPQKLLQPLGNLLKPHKTRVCKNTWSYNGGYVSESVFLCFLMHNQPPHPRTRLPLSSVLFNRTCHVNEELASCCCSTVSPAAPVALSMRCRYHMSHTRKTQNFRITETRYKINSDE